MEINEEILHLLLKNSNDIVLLVNIKGEQFYISDVVSKITGYSVEELKGPILNVIHPDDQELIAQHWNRVIADKTKSDTVQYRHKHKDKGYVWFEVVAQNYLDNPAINAVIANVRDITERKKNEILLKESEDTLAKIIEQIRDALIIIDSEGIIRVWNSGAEELMGLSAKETINRKLADVQYEISPNQTKNRQKIEEGIREIISISNPAIFNRFSEKEIVNNKNIKTIQTVLFPIKLDKKYLFGSISRDITDKVNIQKELDKLNQLKQKMLSEEIDRVSKKLDKSEKEMTISTLKLIQNSERDALVIERLMDLQKNVNQEVSGEINALILSYKQSSCNSNWNEFEILFNNVHQSFYEKLSVKFPNLTVTERKVCAFLKLNMNSKEIMKITFQSEEALKKVRLRLRKKLGIARDINLNVFLQSI